MAEPQYDPNGLGNGAPDSSEANGNLPERFAGMSAEQIAAQYQQYEQQTQARMQELEPAWQAYQELQPYGGYDALKQAYAQTYNEYQQLLQQVGGQQQMNQQPNYQQPSGDDWTSNWDYLSPQEQAQRLAQHNLQQLSQVAEQYRQQLRQELQTEARAEFERQRREFDVYRSVLDRQRKEPDLDATQLLQEAVGISQAPPEKLMDVAARILADKSGKSQAEIDRLAQERFEQMKATWEQEQQNRELSSLNDGGNAFPFGQFRDAETGATPSKQDAERRVMEKLLRDPNSGFTRAHFS